MCKSFFCFPIRATLTIVVVEDIELEPFNNPTREGLHLPTYGPPTKEVAHPWRKVYCYRRRLKLWKNYIHQKYFPKWLMGGCIPLILPLWIRPWP